MLKYLKGCVIINKRLKILEYLIITSIFILIINLFYVQIIKHDYYKEKAANLSQKVILGSNPPRGRIYDRNGILIVDNKEIKVVYFIDDSYTTQEKAEIAQKLSKLLEINYSINDEILAEYWLINNKIEADKKITLEEKERLKRRELTNEDILKLKKERITNLELESVDKEEAYIYYLMNQGYYYDEKIIKKNLTDQEFAIISEANIEGINTKIDWERVYLYGNTFKTILGSIGSIPYEKKNEYLDKGYSLNDIVGTSYLEYQYEEVLKGKKDTYILNNGNKELLSKGCKGSDIYLTIDIELQKEIESIVMNEVTKTKSEPNTDYYNRSFVIISNPVTGEILAMTGKQVVKENGSYVILDYTPGITTSPVAVGSVIKGASHIVGYNTGAIIPGQKLSDDCIKIASTPLKCSWRTLGYQDDISALKNSSNVFQYKTAIKVGKGKYIYNGPLTIDPRAFNTYRKTFNEFGLGVLTNIDLPVESLGYIGTKTDSGFLLDFATGQYDTYTPIQLNQYINTIANGGSRMRPYLLKGYYEKEKFIETKPLLLNKLNTKEEYLSRVQKGFRQVLLPGGTGSTYIDQRYKAAGKTGTSQSFVDANQDNVIDTETLTNTFSGYAPFDNPKVSFTIVSPDISHTHSRSTYRSNVNRRISYQISKKFFEIYK